MLGNAMQDVESDDGITDEQMVLAGSRAEDIAIDDFEENGSFLSSSTKQHMAAEIQLLDDLEQEVSVQCD
jgi:hypothetical protein